MKKLYYVFLFLILLFVAVPEENTASLMRFKGSTISVEVKGEVENPGVYELDVNSTVYDLLQFVKLTDEADISSVNQNEILANKDVLVIPKISEVKKVSINTATLEELVTIPGIGEVTAQKIIDYRNSNGLFKAIDELTNISGIGEKKLEKMRDYICF